MVFIWEVYFDDNTPNEKVVIEEIKKNTGIENLQYDYEMHEFYSAIFFLILRRK